MTRNEMTARYKNIFIVASEKILREIYAEDRRGEPSPAQLEASREAALGLYMLVTEKDPPPTQAQIDAGAEVPDEVLLARLIQVLRPKIRMVLSTVRPS